LNGGKAVEQRRVVYDSRGHVSELLAKCVDKHYLDQDMTSDDRERMLSFLKQYGDLTPDYKFKSTERAGYTVYPGAGTVTGQPHDPFPMHELLSAELWEGMLVEDNVDWQATMFQPIGGMDQIPKAFEKSLGSIIRHNADVQDIDQSDTGVHVAYRDTRTGKSEKVSADYCICAMPLTVLAKTQNNFSPEVKAAIADSKYDSAYKVAWESPRFWETDFNIYGGLSYLRQTVGIVWYPSWGLFSPRGVIISGYSIENGTPFGALPTPAAKLDASRRAVELLHPGYGDQLTKPVYISWGHIPYNLGSWISESGRKDSPDYATLLKPDGRVYFAGDHTSHIVGWQEGAAVSAIRAVNMIGTQVGQGAKNA
jgi:monoamine oxidase